MDLVLLLKRGSLGLLFLSIFAFIIFLILVIVNYTVKPIFNFTPFSTNTVSYITPTIINETVYSTIRCPNDTAIRFDKIENINFSNFTLSFDCFIDGTYKSTDVPRVLFYFGRSPADIRRNNDLKEYNGTNNIPNVLDITNTDILTVFNSTNFIIYLDPIKNDLRVGVVTKNTSNTEYLELIPAIENVPINKVFQITMVLSNIFLEVYINKKLVKTHKIGSTSGGVLNISRVSGSSKIYSPINFIGDTIKVANIQYFDGVINSSQVRNLTNAPLIIIN
jgi:hypothetical protein